MSKAFTLIELLVVVLIIGILSAIALPQYQKSVFKARAAEAISMLHSLDRAQNVCVLENNNIFCELDNLSIDLPSELTDDCAEDDQCFKTKNWEYGTDGAAMYVYPIDGGTTNNNLMISMDFGDNGSIRCHDNLGSYSGKTYEGYCRILNL